MSDTSTPNGSENIPFDPEPQGGHSKKFQQGCSYFGGWGEFGELLWLWVAQNESNFWGLKK